MKEPVTLTDAQWSIILELLERERSDLPAEIRHTRGSMHDELQERLHAIDRILEKLHAAIGR